MNDAQTLLKMLDVSKHYAAPAGGPGSDVLRGVNLQVDRGQCLAVVGPSGSGKSTLLNLIGALDRPSSGRVLLDGADLADLSDAELAALRNRKIGFVFQLHHLLPQCTVLENVLLPTLAWTGDPPADAPAPETRARRLLERVGLTDRLDHRPGQLSGGECQRVAVVRALINEPELLLADEPTGSLDRAGADGLGELLVGLNRDEGVTLIVVTHSRRLAEQMGRTMQLQDGVLRDGPGERP